MVLSSKVGYAYLQYMGIGGSCIPHALHDIGHCFLDLLALAGLEHSNQSGAVVDNGLAWPH